MIDHIRTYVEGENHTNTIEKASGALSHSATAPRQAFSYGCFTSCPTFPLLGFVIFAALAFLAPLFFLAFVAAVSVALAATFFKKSSSYQLRRPNVPFFRRWNFPLVPVFFANEIARLRSLSSGFQARMSKSKPPASKALRISSGWHACFRCAKYSAADVANPFP